MRDLKLFLILMTAPLALLFAVSTLADNYARYQHVRDFGERATAIVQSIELASYVQHEEGGRRLFYALDLPGPAYINGSAYLSHAVASRYSPGQEIGIVYAATDPTHHALSVEDAWSTFAGHLVIFGAYCALLALALLNLRSSPLKSWRDAR
ncbi:MAG: hypothetical protein AB7S70_03825 [Hyphomicrobium sp.]|uniref:hypothetical protein n=1 Tax=Hyphomicrobium sp. TaxID=82 RepID=UPI003D1248FC